MPIRAEQVGSLLRPPALLAARAAFADGRLDLSSLRAKEDEAIRAAVVAAARDRPRRARRRRDAALLVADRHGRLGGRLHARQRDARVARARRRSGEDHGENRRRDAAQAADADGRRSAAHEIARASFGVPSAIQGDGARAVELRPDRLQAWRHRSLLQGPRRPARGSRRHRPRGDRVARRSGRHLHPARRAVLLALSRPAASCGHEDVGRRSRRGVRWPRSPATTRRLPASRGTA